MRCVCVYVCMYVGMYKRVGPVPISLSLLNRCCRMDLCRCLTQLILRGRRKPFGLLRPLYRALTALTLLSVIVLWSSLRCPAQSRESTTTCAFGTASACRLGCACMSSMHTRNKDSQAGLSRPNLLDSKGNEREQSSRTPLSWFRHESQRLPTNNCSMTSLLSVGCWTVDSLGTTACGSTTWEGSQTLPYRHRNAVCNACSSFCTSACRSSYSSRERESSRRS